MSIDIIYEHFKSYNSTLFFSSREGLNYIYKQLYNERGSLRVAVSPLTCFIALYPIVLNGHIPVFVDIDEKTLNMNEDSLSKINYIDVIQVIHLGGNPMNMSNVMNIAKRNNCIVIEDCAQALGSTWNGAWVGGFGDYSVFSVVKNIHNWIGGLLLYKSNDLININHSNVSAFFLMYKKLKVWLESRVSYNNTIYSYVYKLLLTLKDCGQSEVYDNSSRKLNDDISAQIYKKILKFVGLQQEREVNANYMIKELDCETFHIQKEISEYAHSNRNRLMFISEVKMAKQVISELRDLSIAANNLTQNYLCGYQEHIANDKMLYNYYTESLPVYEKILPKVVTIPCSAALKENEINYIIENVKNVIK